MHWSEDRVDRLTELWGRGLSASRIAEDLNIGRGAVLSKARRLSLEERPMLSVDERMARCFDIITDAELNQPVTLRDASRMAGVAYKTALGRWRAICRHFGEVGDGGDKLERAV